jgi:hypothetical protein
MAQAPVLLRGVRANVYRDAYGAAFTPAVHSRSVATSCSSDASQRPRGVDEFLPEFDVSDEIQTTVAADVATTWRTLIEADLVDVGKRRPLVAVLGAVRILPEMVWQLLHGERPSGAPDRLTLLDTTKLPMSGGGWVLLGQRPEEEIALELVGSSGGR